MTSLSKLVRSAILPASAIAAISAQEIAAQQTDSIQGLPRATWNSARFDAEVPGWIIHYHNQPVDTTFVEDIKGATIQMHESDVLELPTAQYIQFQHEGQDAEVSTDYWVTRPNGEFQLAPEGVNNTCIRYVGNQPTTVNVTRIMRHTSGGVDGRNLEEGTNKLTFTSEIFGRCDTTDRFDTDTERIPDPDQETSVIETQERSERPDSTQEQGGDITQIIINNYITLGERGRVSRGGDEPKEDTFVPPGQEGNNYKVAFGLIAPFSSLHAQDFKDDPIFGVSGFNLSGQIATESTFARLYMALKSLELDPDELNAYHLGAEAIFGQPFGLYIRGDLFNIHKQGRGLVSDDAEFAQSTWYLTAGPSMSSQLNKDVYASFFGGGFVKSTGGRKKLGWNAGLRAGIDRGDIGVEGFASYGGVARGDFIDLAGFDPHRIDTGNNIDVGVSIEKMLLHDTKLGDIGLLFGINYHQGTEGVEFSPTNIQEAFGRHTDFYLNLAFDGIF